MPIQKGGEVQVVRHQLPQLDSDSSKPGEQETLPPQQPIHGKDEEQEIGLGYVLREQGKTFTLKEGNVKLQTRLFTNKTDYMLPRVRKQQGVVVIGGRSRRGQSLQSVEMYSLSRGRWIELPEMNIPRAFHSSVVVGHEIIVSGGDVGDSVTDSIEILNLDQTPLQWKISDARLPVPLCAHQTVVYEGKLIIIGGYNDHEAKVSNKIYDIPLTVPHTPRDLCSLPQARAWHGAELVNDKVYIFGGGKIPAVTYGDILVYDISRNCCSKIGELPYPVQGMATVRRGNRVFLIGGVDETEQELDEVIKYHILVGKTTKLSRMNAKRGGCCAVIGVTPDMSTGCSLHATTSTLVVLGSLQHFNAVEGYDFQKCTWKDMAPTKECRSFCTAIASPINIEVEC